MRPPRRRTASSALAVALAAALAASHSGCFAVADLDRFEFGQCPALPLTRRTSFEYALTSFAPHATPDRPQRFELAVFDDTNRPVAKVIYDPLLSPNVEGRLRDALSPGSGYAVEFWADLDRNGMVSVPPADHSWTDCLSVQPDGAVRFQFEHALPLQPLRWTTFDHEDRYDFLLRFVNVPLLLRSSTTFVFEVREMTTDLPVIARYFLTGAPRGEAMIRITDILRADQAYEVDVWIDTDRAGHRSGVRDSGEPGLERPFVLVVADDGTYPIEVIDVDQRVARP
jgi:hypothetical protein